MRAPVPQEVLQDVGELRCIRMNDGIDFRLLFTNFGPVAFLNDDDSVACMLDQTALNRMAAAAA